MPGTTRGLRYPISTEQAKNGALAIQHLAEDVDTKAAFLVGGVLTVDGVAVPDTALPASLARDSEVIAALAAAAADRVAAEALLIPKSLFDFPGDLLTATAPDAPARLAVGANGQALFADSSQPTGLRWGALIAASAGQVFADAQSGLYVPTGGATWDSATYTCPAVNVLEAQPLMVNRDCTLNALAFEVTVASASGLGVLALYADDGTGYPGARVANFGTVSTSSIGTKTLSVANQPLTANTLYWLVVGHTTAVAGLRGCRLTTAAGSATVADPLTNGRTMWSNNTGAPPANWNATRTLSGASGLAPRVLVKVA